MTRINIHEAKTHLSRYIDKVLEGETVIICRRNEPVAELRATPVVRKEPRPMGLGRGLVHMDDSFFDPLPDELLDLFEGKGE